jgi:hypothetical protein
LAKPLSGRFGCCRRSSRVAKYERTRSEAVVDAVSLSFGVVLVVGEGGDERGDGDPVASGSWPS